MCKAALNRSGLTDSVRRPRPEPRRSTIRGSAKAAPCAPFEAFILYVDENGFGLEPRQTKWLFSARNLSLYANHPDTVIVLTFGSGAMWWVEQAEKDAERERQKKVREKRAHQLIDRQLKDYWSVLVGASVPCAETLLDRAVQMHYLDAA